MKLFLVAPVIAANSDESANSARVRECAERIAELIASHLEDDPAIFAMRQAGEISEAPVPPDNRYGDIDTARIANPETLRTILRENGDPSSGNRTHSLAGDLSGSILRSRWSSVRLPSERRRSYRIA